MTSTKPFLLGALTATVALAVGLAVGTLTDDEHAVAPQTTGDLTPQIEALTRAIEALARESRAPLRASAPHDTGPGAEAAATPIDPRPLDVGPTRDELAAQVAALRARLAELEVRGVGGGTQSAMRPLDGDGRPAPRIEPRTDRIAELIDGGAPFEHLSMLTKQQVYAYLGKPTLMRHSVNGDLGWTYHAPPRPKMIWVEFEDGFVRGSYLMNVD